jgi:hypothetical protein
MPNDCISYQKSGYFTKLMIDYLDEKPELNNCTTVFLPLIISNNKIFLLKSDKF